MKLVSFFSLLFLFFLLQNKIARGIVLSGNDTLDQPPSFVPTPAQGNYSVYETWMNICKNDTKCAELYGISQTTSITQFVHLITIANPFSGGIKYLENARIYDLYGHTVEEIEKTILLYQMKLGILCSNFVCGVNEKPFVVNGTVHCNPLPGRTPSDTNIREIILDILIILGVVLLAVAIIKSGYQFSKDSWELSQKAIMGKDKEFYGMNASHTSTTMPSNLETHRQVRARIKKYNQVSF